MPRKSIHRRACSSNAVEESVLGASQPIRAKIHERQNSSGGT
jgi:hypothetical protein